MHIVQNIAKWFIWAGRWIKILTLAKRKCEISKSKHGELKKASSLAGNRTPVSCVTDRDTQPLYYQGQLTFIFMK